MDTLETVKVVNAADPAGYMLINKSDFVEGVHQLFEPEAAGSRKKKADPAPVDQPAAE